MTYSTVQGVPSSTAVVHPWISHPPARSRKNTTSKPLLAPRCCHAASSGKDANDTASTFPPPEEKVTTPEDRTRRIASLPRRQRKAVTQRGYKVVQLGRGQYYYDWQRLPLATPGGQSRAIKDGRRCLRASSRRARWRARAPCRARTSGTRRGPCAC